MTENLTPERAVRLLRAHAAELENFAKGHIVQDPHHFNTTQAEIGHLAADIALISTILADHMEHCRSPWGPEPEVWGPDSPGYDEMGQ